MKIFEAIKKASEIIEKSNTPQLDAEVILSNLLNKDRIYLYLNREEKLNEDLKKYFFELVERRKNGEPVQYIVGKQEFMGMDFIVKPGILIPRGDTEILVERALKMLKGIKNPVVVDVGCGSGAIGISVARIREDSFVYMLDIMDIPLEVTKLNAIANGVKDRVKIIKSDMLEELDKALIGRIDAVISNPPYIRDNELCKLMKGVRDYEPHYALSGGEDGLYFYRNITKQALKFLSTDGFITYEIGFEQREDVISILKAYNFKDITCDKDLSGLDRVISGWR